MTNILFYVCSIFIPGYLKVSFIHSFLFILFSAFRFPALFFALVSGLGAMLCDISLSAGRNYELAIMRVAPNCRSINNSNENKALSLV